MRLRLWLRQHAPLAPPSTARCDAGGEARWLRLWRRWRCAPPCAPNTAHCGVEGGEGVEGQRPPDRRRTNACPVHPVGGQHTHDLAAVWPHTPGVPPCHGDAAPWLVPALMGACPDRCLLPALRADVRGSHSAQGTPGDSAHLSHEWRLDHRLPASKGTQAVSTCARKLLGRGHAGGAAHLSPLLVVGRRHLRGGRVQRGSIDPLWILAAL